jgi:hypothetical protein
LSVRQDAGTRRFWLTAACFKSKRVIRREITTDPISPIVFEKKKNMTTDL